MIIIRPSILKCMVMSLGGSKDGVRRDGEHGQQ